jgi:carotenoid cleavage dioxygenase-like enzyme
VAAEFPRADPRFTGKARRFTIHATAASRDRPLFQGVGLFDRTTGQSAVCDLGASHLVEEMVFAPRPGRSAEMDGYLIGPAVNLKAKASELLVFDALRLEDGPLCTWRADVLVPIGLHGGFTSA